MTERLIVAIGMVLIAVAGYALGRQDINREFREQMQKLADREKDINNILNIVVNSAAKRLPTAKDEKAFIKEIEQKTGQTFSRKIVGNKR